MSGYREAIRAALDGHRYFANEHRAHLADVLAGYMVKRMPRHGLGASPRTPEHY